MEGGGVVGAVLVTASILFFKALRVAFAQFPVPEAVLRHKDDFKVFRYRNLVISACHASITGLWALASFLTNRYVVPWEILGSAVYTVLANDCIGYHTMAMLIEINTVFLHARKLLQVSGWLGSSRVVLVNRWINLLTFIVFRFGPLYGLVVAVIREWNVLPPTFVYYFTVAVFVLGVVNLILFWRLIRADVQWLRSTTHQFTRGHTKMDSMAGMCGSLTLFEDNASYTDLRNANTLISLSETDSEARRRR